MRGAAMGSTTAASGFVVFLLSVSVVQGQNDWGVTYTSTHICALKGSTVVINCTYRYPSRVNNVDTAVGETLWFTKGSNEEPVDLKTDSEYAGRVQYHCDENDCTLRITDLRERDSAEYKFMFTTNHPGGKYTASAGVNLTVTDFQVKVIKSTHYSYDTRAELECNSSCRLPDHSSYIWYKNGKEIYRGNSLTYSSNVNHADSYSCAVTGYEDFRSLPVYAPKLPSVSVSTSSEIKEGSSVTLTCRSDANPEVKYTWEKSGGSEVISRGRQLVFKSIKPSDSGGYYCTAENELGRTPKYTLIRVKLVHGQNDWGVTYTSTHICALKGSTVDINCTYRYPPRENNVDTAVNETFWFTKLSNNEPVDLRTDSDYAGRVQYHCDKNNCTLRITDLRERDSAEYKFRFTTNHPKGKYTGSAGVTLNVTDLQVQVIGATACKARTCGLKCHSSCHLEDRPSYVWYKNGQMLKEQPSPFYLGYFHPADSYSCALKGHEMFSSPSLYARLTPSVSVSPSGGITESSSVTLTCSSDANPAAKYTWYKKNVNPDLRPLSKEPQLVFSSIQSSESGEYYCTAESRMEKKTTSEYICIDVEYAPKLPSVSVSPSAEIVEGSSVTLTCSSDANPAANYTWYKENEASPKASGQIFTITYVRSEHNGNYSCEAQNRRGSHNSTLHLTVVKGTGTAIGAGVTAAVLLLIIILSVFLWMRKKRVSNQPSEAEERPDETRERTQPEQDNLHYASVQFSNNQADPLYSNIRSDQLHSHMEEQEVIEYAAVNFNRAGNAPRTTGQETGEDPAALYSTVNKTS